MKWDEWRGQSEAHPTMLIKHLVRAFGFEIDLHKFVGADAPDCYHTHPAHAIRIVLTGGYTEELYFGEFEGRSIAHTFDILPGHMDWITPDTCHRISGLLNGKASYSLWLRGRIVRETELRGPGWQR